MRDTTPVLAVGNRILIIADIEIADSVKVTASTKNLYKLTYDQELI